MKLNNMDIKAIAFLMLLSNSKQNKPIFLKVSGMSMWPTIIDGDIIKIESCELYENGDILVFDYKNEGILVHRLLYIINDRFFCKGDNSFRIEDIERTKIIGKVVLCNDTVLKGPLKYQVELSKKVNEIFCKYGYDANYTMNTPLFRFYMQYLTSSIEKSLLYVKSDQYKFCDFVKEPVMGTLQKSILQFFDNPGSMQDFYDYLSNESKISVDLEINTHNLHHIVMDVFCELIIDGFLLVL